MKKVFFGSGLNLLLLALPLAVCAQGTITFNTFNGANTNRGQVFHYATSIGIGATYVGQLWWSDTVDGTYVAAGNPLSFSPAPSYVQNGSVTIPGRAPGASVFIQMRVWNSNAGATWCAAVGPFPGWNPALTSWSVTQPKSHVLAGIWNDLIFPPQQYNDFTNAYLAVLETPYPPNLSCGATPRPLLTMTPTGSELVLNWTGPFILQSATNVTGVYVDLPVTTIPHTNSMDAGQQFFRLRN